MKPSLIQAFPITAVVVGLLTVILLIGDPTTRWFVLGSVALGGIVAGVLRLSQRATPEIADESRRPEISMHRMPVGGGLAGLIFVVGSCLVFLVGIPALRWFLLGAVAVGSLVGGLLWRWHKIRPVEITDIHDANG